MHHGNRKHRGSIYVVLLGMSMLVGVIGLAAMLAGRVQVHAGAAAANFSVARLCARAGLEMAMYRIQNDANWRTDYGNGAWLTNISLGQGMYSVSASDPITGDVTVASNHPVLLTSTGMMGAASYSMQTQVLVNQPAISCANVNMCGGGGISVSKSTLNSNQTVTSNSSFSADNKSTISASAQAIGSFGGGAAYSQPQQSITTALTLPDTTHVFDYYNANGTAISYTSLYQSNNTQIVTNPSFESNVSGWYVLSPSSSSAKLSQSNAQKQDGTFSMLMSGRNGSGDVPAQDLPVLSIRNGDTYAIQVPVYGSGLLSTVQATIVIQSSAGTQSFSTSSQTFSLGGGWVNCKGNVTISWTGTLTKATLTLTCSSTTGNIYVDKISLTDTTFSGGAYVMDRVLLSPNSNPYGTTNSQGIYILNCNNQNVTIGPCRIVGTLVLLNAGNNSTISGPITWEPAVSGYPALLSNEPMTISFTGSGGLSEATYGINFNPSGTPYPYLNGVANTTASDGFPSTINGLIYCVGNLSFTSASNVNGSVIASGQINLNSATLNLTYNPASYLSPPPGFISSSQAVYALPGSWQRVTH